METVIVSQKFQIVLPKLIRRSLGIEPKEKLVVIEKKGVIELIPVGKMSEAKGLAKGVTTKKLRDESERFS
ncbi:MAG: AbrB/MazE/SpoVT family DNA-binding domain-containing protein [Candidatus Diapherotrites archaeon]